ncbi:uncharacterized protein [Procambarus clarkii]|uniref:uncharacterized protein isoform X2 n=1 Tax=Procambarus clarkii TaxID=6728 RepID=UPI0037435D2D
MADTDPGHCWGTLPASGDVHRTGHLQDTSTRTHLCQRLSQEDYYNTVKFAIGYQELQKRWSTGWGLQGHRDSLQGHRDSLQGHRDSLQGHRDSLQGHRASLQGHRDSLQGHRDSLQCHRNVLLEREDEPWWHRDTFQKHRETKGTRHRKNSLHLPIRELAIPTAYPEEYVGEAASSSRLWDSMAGNMSLGRPSSLLSTLSSSSGDSSPYSEDLSPSSEGSYPSPGASSPYATLSALGRAHEMENTSVQETLCTSSPKCASFPVGTSSQGSCGGDDGVVDGEGTHSEYGDDSCSSSNKGRWTEILEKLRGVLRNLKRQPPLTPTPSALHTQVCELQAELQVYKQLSETKRRSADLLKHQLMEVLYEQVVSQLEHKQRRRQLEEEVVALEFEVHLLRGSSHHDLHDLSNPTFRTRVCGSCGESSTAFTDCRCSIHRYSIK